MKYNTFFHNVPCYKYVHNNVSTEDATKNVALTKISCPKDEEKLQCSFIGYKVY